MTTTNGNTSPVPAAGVIELRRDIREAAGVHIDVALEHLYQASALVAGAAQLAQAVPFVSAHDKTLQGESVAVAERALSAVERAHSLAGYLTQGFAKGELSEVHVEIESAEGQLRAAAALLEATRDRDQFDESTRALDLYAMAAARFKPVKIALWRAEEARANATTRRGGA